MDELSSVYQHKVSILTRQLDQLQVNQTFLEDVLKRATSSVQSPSDVQFLLSRPDIVSMLKTEESYSMVLEPEARFLPEFTREKKNTILDTMVRIQILPESLVISKLQCELSWDGFLRVPIFFSGRNSLADILDIAVVIHRLVYFPVLVMFSSRI